MQSCVYFTSYWSCIRLRTYWIEHYVWVYNAPYFPCFFLLMYKMYNNLIVGFSWENLQYISPLLYSLSLSVIDRSIDHHFGGGLTRQFWFSYHNFFFFRLTWKKLSPVQYLRRVVVVPDSRYSVNLEKGFIVPLQYYRI